MLLALFFGLLGSVGAMSGAALLLAFPDAIRKRLLSSLLAYATGTLLGAAFLDMIPKGLEMAPALAICSTARCWLARWFFSCWRNGSSGATAMTKTARPGAIGAARSSW
jgi:zinc and cadmium transporter